MKKILLRGLPKMDKLLETDIIKKYIDKIGRDNIVNELRNILNEARKNILNENIKSDVDEKYIIEKLNENIRDKFSSTIKNVVNGTGVIIHTNLGRSLLSERAINNLIRISKEYSNLEYNLESGKRGSRYIHVEELLKSLTGAEAALVVNNNAAAVLLVLSEISSGKEAIVSRGELVEIGGSFRIPDVMKMSGSRLVEVGTTNKTHLYDYKNAINSETGALVKIHSSNFKIIGYTSEVGSRELAEVGQQMNIPTIEDLGSGALLDLEEFKIDEKTVKSVVDAGIDIVTFSGDKLLGGPQAGIIVGKKEYIDRLKKNQLLRALRVDKFTLAALEGTLFDYLDKDKAYKNIPTLNMINKSIEELETKAQKLKERILLNNNQLQVEIVKEEDFIGGGTLPTYILNGIAIEIYSNKFKIDYIEKYLRNYKKPIIGRIKNDKYKIHMRTLRDGDIKTIEEAVNELGKEGI